MATGSSRPTPAPTTFDELDPAFEWSREEGPDIIRIHLPGFKRDNIRVQVDNYGNLIASGERPIDGTRKSRFRKEFSIPERCNVDGINARFENEVLYIVLPKKKATIPPAPQTATTEPQPKPRPPSAPESGAGGVLSAAETATKQAGAKSSELADARATGKTVAKDVKDSEKEKERLTTVGDGKAVGDDKGGEKGTEKDVKQADKRGMEQKTETVTSESLEDETGTKTASELTKPRAQQLLLNVAVAILVLMGLAMFATYKLAKAT